MTTSLFRTATNTSAFLKMGIMGKQGAGKTKTAAKVAIGLVKHLKTKGISYANKPVAFFDTETGSDYVMPDFEAAGIPLVVAKTKTLADLIEAMDWAEANASVMIIDSITHPYRELIAAYLKKKGRTFLQIDDWNYLKGDYGWAQFTKRYINSKLHIIMCGRAGDDLEQYTDEDGKRQLEKVGVKMKTEAETGFEPSLLVLMEMIERDHKSSNNGRRQRTFINRATVVKDRWDKINGDEFDDPGFEEFLPHVNLLALGGEHVGVRDSGDSQHILKTEKRDWQPVQRRIAVDEIQTLLVLHIPGQAAADKKRKVELIRKHFDNKSWTEIEEVMPLLDLRAGFDTLHEELEGKPSRYRNMLINAREAVTVAPIDELPAHSAPPAKLPKAVTIPITQDNGGDGGIPVFLQRQPTHAAHHDDVMAQHATASAPPMIPANPKDKLLRDIPLLSSVSECLQWGLEMSPAFDTLSVKDKRDVHSALVARQMTFLNGSGLHA